MLKLFKGFLKEEDGLTTVEVVIMIAILVGIALIFRKAIFTFVNSMIEKIFQTEPFDPGGPGGSPSEPFDPSHSG